MRSNFRPFTLILGVDAIDLENCQWTATARCMRATIILE